MVNYDKIGVLFQQNEFKEEANECKTMQDFRNLFVKNGIDITEEETVNLISQIAENKQKMDNGEIYECDLDDVSGGLGFITILGIAFTKAQIIKLGIAAIGATALGVWNGHYRTRK